MRRIGIDTGGTFTDLVLWQDGGVAGTQGALHARGARAGDPAGHRRAGIGPGWAAGDPRLHRGDQAVRRLLSGPAGGLAGAGFAGRLAGIDKLLTFDMGGTSTDVALVDGEPRLTMAGRIAGYPVALPMVDMHTIGAGGGSIARLDAGASCWWDPGPACYGKGGSAPTVTDANLVLGRLRSDAFEA